MGSRDIPEESNDNEEHTRIAAFQKHKPYHTRLKVSCYIRRPLKQFYVSLIVKPSPRRLSTVTKPSAISAHLNKKSKIPDLPSLTTLRKSRASWHRTSSLIKSYRKGTKRQLFRRMSSLRCARRRARSIVWLTFWKRCTHQTISLLRKPFFPGRSPNTNRLWTEVSLVLSTIPQETLLIRQKESFSRVVTHLRVNRLSVNVSRVWMTRYTERQFNLFIQTNRNARIKFHLY